MSLAAVSRKVGWHLGPILAAFVFVLVIKFIDTTFFPVVEEFRITEKNLVPGGVVIKGLFHKGRDCDLISVLAYAKNGNTVKISYPGRVADDIPEQRAARTQAWGPWYIASGDSSTVSIYIKHSCHPLWNHNAELIQFDTGAYNEDQIPS